MEWSALVIGLLSGLAGGTIGAATGLIAILVRAESEVESEVREARRAHRRERSQPYFEFLDEAERYHGNVFVRRTLDRGSGRLKDAARQMGFDVTDEQLAAFNEQLKEQKAPIADWIDVTSKFMGPIQALEEGKLRDNLILLTMQLSSPIDAPAFRPDQMTLLLWNARILLEKYVSVVPVRHRSFLERLKRALGIGVEEWENLPVVDSESLKELRAEIDAMEPPKEPDRSTGTEN